MAEEIELHCSAMESIIKGVPATSRRNRSIPRVTLAKPAEREEIARARSDTFLLFVNIASKHISRQMPSGPYSDKFCRIRSCSWVR